ncbi:MAG: insulinase family protein [Oscillospiraceae bacterium]|nr:insulinase family protein [Oscillospiraceae bacterium]
MINYEKYCLDNGFNIISVYRPSNLISINFCTKIGTIFENKKNKGICHFIEHMLFKGTKKYTNDEINFLFESLGGSYNAYTDLNSTVITLTALTEEFSNCLNVLSEVILNSIFPSDEFEKERMVILNEIRMVNDDIEELSYLKLMEKAFIKPSLKYDILGLKENIKNFNREDVYDFYKKNYVPNNSHLVIVSSLSHDEVFNEVKRCFNEWKYECYKSPKFIYEKNKEGIFIENKIKFEQGTLCYLFSVNGITKKEELALRMIIHKLGGGFTSDLVKELREKKGLVYDVYAEYQSNKYIKMIFIYASLDKDKMDETKSIIDKCIDNVTNDYMYINESDLHIITKILKTSMISNIEDVETLCSLINQEILEECDIGSFINEIEEVKEIDLKFIVDVARKYLKGATVQLLK